SNSSAPSACTAPIIAKVFGESVRSDRTKWISAVDINMDKALLGFFLGAMAALGQPLDQAYAALRAKNYDDAIRNCEQAALFAPARSSNRKDLAYTLLKIGESERARDQFAEAMRLDPADDQIALEYAYLCYETKQPVMARRVFGRLRAAGNPM